MLSTPIADQSKDRKRRADIEGLRALGPNWGQVIFRDSRHITNSYAESLRQDVLNAIVAAE